MPEDAVPSLNSEQPTLDRAAHYSAGSFGRYRLLQRLGEGGMGEVWLAEQTEPVRRQVALKVIKAGMDSAQVIARFEAERQALALMDHPAIATVFDGGTTPQGRPYFAMEYVKGEPITGYCDRHRLSTPERLQLFMGSHRSLLYPEMQQTGANRPSSDQRNKEREHAQRVRSELVSSSAFSS